MKRLAMLVAFLIPIAAPMGCSADFAPVPDDLSKPPEEPGPEPILANSSAPAWFSVDVRRGDERTVMSRLKATERDARLDLREQLRRSVRGWLVENGIPRGWSPPDRMVDSMVRATHVERIDKDYGTLYLAADRVDFSNERGARFAELYRSELVGRRLASLGGLLGFVLISLGGLAAYIRADEATRGYYTARLRLVAAAAVGASGVAIYRMLS